MMKSFLSIIYLQTNSVSGEKIAAGLLAVSGDEIFYKTSEQKIKLASKLFGAELQKHADLTFTLISNKVNETNKENKSHSLLKNDSLFTKEYISYLNKYSKGLLLFDQPKAYSGIIDKKVFKVLFEKFIGQWEEIPAAGKKMPGIQKVIHKKLNSPVFKEKVDVDYTLQPEKVKGLLVPKDITLISKNGNILAAQAVDFNHSEDIITRHAYELEVIINCLQKFAEQAIGSNHKGKYYMLFNKPGKNSAQ